MLARVSRKKFRRKQCLSVLSAVSVVTFDYVWLWGVERRGYDDKTSASEDTPSKARGGTFLVHGKARGGTLNNTFCW